MGLWVQLELVIPEGAGPVIPEGAGPVNPLFLLLIFLFVVLRLLLGAPS